jgi:hypothetical protein
MAIIVVASQRIVRARRDSSRVPFVSQMPCDIPLPHVDGDDSSSTVA